MKICISCEQEKPYSEFHKRGNGYQSICKSCRKAFDSEYYQNNKEQRYKSNKEWYKNFLSWYYTLKEGPCVDCGNRFHHAAMQWDHLPQYEKIADVSQLVANGNKTAVLEEIQKCDLVCANCHAIRTFLRRTNGCQTQGGSLALEARYR